MGTKPGGPHPATTRPQDRGVTSFGNVDRTAGAVRRGRGRRTVPDGTNVETVCRGFATGAADPFVGFVFAQCVRIGSHPRAVAPH
jgi:hypothetical protein